ncbi:hypothetical protein LIER_08653 [Lithospermum erythrorhizon]|uniref:Uncharacterized protein n=1 Tax=Lithospermum erythrorhizon TaxID=34254 RepID=A0AAV3PCY5_LITER
MQLTRRELAAEEGEQTWLLVDNYMDKMNKELLKNHEEMKITPPATTNAAITATSNSGATYLTMIVTTTILLLLLNIAYIFIALISTPSGASTILVLCFNALGAWSILKAARKSSLGLY